jgi:hypothetical protein
VTAVVLEFRATPAEPTARQLDIQLTRTQIQLRALIDHVANEALVAELGASETPYTDEQVAARRDHYRRHYTAICLNATAHKRGHDR